MLVISPAVAISFAMQPNWQWVDLVRKKFLDYGFSGYFDELERKYGQKKTSSKVSKAKPVPLRSFLAILIIALATGIGATLFQLFVFFFTKQKKLSPAQKEKNDEHSDYFSR